MSLRVLPGLIALLACSCARSTAPEPTTDALGPSTSASVTPVSELDRLGLPEVAAQPFDRAIASRFAALSIACADKEYPNKPDRILASDADLRPPREVTPAFSGCFDWHSAVHGHWALVRVLGAFPDLPEAASIRALLGRHLTADRMAKEVAFFSLDANKTVERPYGWGWLLRLAAELHESRLPEARQWEEAVRPLAALLSSRLVDYLERLTVPVRAGTHANTAFSLVHALDYARAVNDAKLSEAIEKAAKRFYLSDTGCPTGYEPSGEDFISPCLAEADLMRRVLGPEAFARWLDRFLPPVSSDAFRPMVRPVEIKDRHDPRIGHLIGLSLQRAWALEGITASLPAQDPRAAAFTRIAALHRREAFDQMFDSGYGGSHWLASFAIYLATGCGKTASPPRGSVTGQ